jgi:hypothetical protein
MPLLYKSHTVKDVQVYTAVDMEGHIGTDGRYYVRITFSYFFISF